MSLSCTMEFMEPEQTGEELEFDRAELALIMKQHGLEDFEHTMLKLLDLIKQKMESGAIEKSREGMMQGLRMIATLDLVMDDSLRRFTETIVDKTFREIKQTERPN